MIEENKEKSVEEKNDIDEIDFSQLTAKEKDDIILDMHAEEMMRKRKEIAVDKTKRKKKIRKKKKKEKNQYPGFGKVAFKMATAMTFSMVLILIGPILFIMAIIGKAGVSLFGEMGDKIWVNIIMGLLGVGFVIISWYLFKYLIKD